jgi:hypothetical protein
MMNAMTMGGGLSRTAGSSRAERASVEPACPICTESVRVTKVSRIREDLGQTAKGARLARQLARPEFRRKGRFGVLFENAVYVAGIVLAAVVALLAGLFAVLYFSADVRNTALAQSFLSPATSADLLARMAILLVEAALVGVAGVLAGIYRTRRARREQARTRALHERALARWHAAYYCDRDEVVFLPEEPYWALAISFGEFLYAPREQLARSIGLE